MSANDDAAIRPYKANPYYWQPGGKPVLLLGGSVEDNLFQIDDIEAHLDTLAACGGNYVRCTMSSRDPGNPWPFWRDPESGRYDLTRPEGDYWRNFDRFVELTRARGIVMQIEVFDRFDFAREPWQSNPYNPQNTSTYDEAGSGLKAAYEKHPGQRENPFFRSVPALENNRVLLRFQEIFVERMLQTTRGQPHVLYCISNETNESPEWGKYWAEFIRARAAAPGGNVQITEMWDARDLSDAQHESTYGHPETYTFSDISQVNHHSHQAHWEHLMAFRAKIEATGRPRPLNSVKVYGANAYQYGTTRDAQERFWRVIIAGGAAVRFHRPPTGLGLSELAQANIRSARMLSERFDFTRAVPSGAGLRNCSKNEAFCTAIAGAAYAVYFPDGGDVYLRPGGLAADTPLMVDWLDIRARRWLGKQAAELDAKGELRLVTPREEGYWACVVETGA